MNGRHKAPSRIWPTVLGIVVLLVILGFTAWVIIVNPGSAR